MDGEHERRKVEYHHEEEYEDAAGEDKGEYEDQLQDSYSAEHEKWRLRTMMKITKGRDAEYDERHEGYEEAEDTKRLLRSTMTIIRRETIKGEVKDGKETWHG